jgi:hypothetical protein
VPEGATSHLALHVLWAAMARDLPAQPVGWDTRVMLNWTQMSGVAASHTTLQNLHNEHSKCRPVTPPRPPARPRERARAGVMGAWVDREREDAIYAEMQDQFRPNSQPASQPRLRHAVRRPTKRDKRASWSNVQIFMAGWWQQLPLIYIYIYIYICVCVWLYVGMAVPMPTF